MGRPSSYTPEIAAVFCARLAERGSIRAVCRDEDMPDRGTIATWVDNDIDGFAARCARAKNLGIDDFVEETLEIADETPPTTDNGSTDSGYVAHQRVRIETRRWLAEQLARGRYGNRTAIELTGANGGPVQIDSTKRAARLAAIVGTAQQRRASGGVEDLV